ncbi:MAG: hypothetical protein ABGY29_10095 [bacterium]
MIGLSTSRWVASRLLRQPAFWVLGGTIGALWPTVASLSPMGLTTSEGSIPGVLYEAAFLSVLAGHCLAMTMAGTLEWFVKPLTLVRRATFYLAASTTAAALLLAAALCLPVLLGTPSPPLLALCLTHLHLAAISLILVQIPVPAAARAPALLVSAWILPALGYAVPLLGPALVGIFDAGGHLDLARLSGGTSPTHLLPIAGLALAAWMLEGSTAPEQPAPLQARDR